MPLVLQGATSGQATVQATDAATVTITLPATTGTLALTSGGGSPTFTSITTTSDSTISGIRVGKGGGNGATNTALGISAFAANTSGTYSVALGGEALKANTTGEQNSAVGGYTLVANTTGGYNSGFGTNALFTNTTGAYNTALGNSALAFNTTASNNTAIGYQAGYNQTTGGSNTFLGQTTGQGLTTGYAGIYIGQNNATGSASGGFEIVIGVGITGKGGSTGFISPGGGSMYQGNNSATWSITSDARLKKNIVDNNTGLDVINQIQVRNFEYRLPEEVDAELKPADAIKKEGVQLGVIAQEIQQVSQEFVKTESTGVMSVNSDNLTWYLINAVKELKATVDAQAARIASLEGAK